MKYWIFQSNQVLGPYEPDDLSRHSAFGAESLVCPEGRRGTSMGDWQRAGMVPDLSVALVRSTQSRGPQSSVATLAGLPPEPTLKDLAVLGSLQEKMAMMEDVVLQLQEGLRLKDAELASLHQDLAGKDRQSSVMKTAMDREAAELKLETEERKREAEDLQAQTNEFKKKMSELEERVGVVNRLSETIDRAVEAEKHVEHDVEAQGATIAELTKEIESLRVQLSERLAAATTSAAEIPALAPMPAASADLPSLAPPPPPPPSAALESLAPASQPSPSFPSSEPLPSFGGAMPSFGAAPADGLMSMPMDPMSGTLPLPPSEPAEPATAAVAAGDASPAPAPGGRKKALMLGGLFGLVALAGGAYMTGLLGGKKKPVVPESMADTAPLPTPTLPPPAPVVAAPVVDPRETAIEAAKEWELPDGRRLGQALETLSPPIGNLSPWMAEPLTDGRLSVNYFAHGGASGAPTVAYEFEVDLGAKTVAGRNPAAKAVLAGKAVAPPAPPKPKKVKIKPKAKAPAAKPKPKEENLDSLLGDEPLAKPEAAPAKIAPAKTADSPRKMMILPLPGSSAPAGGIDDLIAPGDKAPAEPLKPAKPTTAKRAAKASAKAAPKEGKAADEALLDDILKE